MTTGSSSTTSSSSSSSSSSGTENLIYVVYSASDFVILNVNFFSPLCIVVAEFQIVHVLINFELPLVLGT